MNLFSKFQISIQSAMVVLITFSVGSFLTPAVANMCPFCSAINLTFSQQLDSNDVVVVARLIDVPPPVDDPEADFPKAEFQIDQVIKGNEFVATKMKFRTQLVGSYPAGQKFLVMGIEPPRIAWTTPMKASDRVFKYLSDIQTLPKSGPKRLEFFQNYFEDSESILAFDAYDEFAQAPYDDLLALKDQMHREKLVEWILDPDTSINRRRLYFTMLGVCGTPEDVQMLEELIKSGDRKKMAGLDALISSYLTLKGEPGVDLIEQTFLADPDADYVDANAAVSALRFQGTELNRISKDRIVTAVRHLLDRPKMADMIIPDLARWEDWSVMERLVQMFKDADEESNWLRVPVITYLRACPKPEAKKYIEELTKIDPDAVKRADFFLGGFGDEGDDEQETTDDEKEVDRDDPPQEPKTNDDITHTTPYSVQKIPLSTDDLNSVQLASMVEPTTQLNKSDFSQVVSAGVAKTAKSGQPVNRERPTFVSISSSSPGALAPAAENPPQITESTPVAAVPRPSLTWSIIFVPMGISLLIFLLMWSVVNGGFQRLIF